MRSGGKLEGTGKPAGRGRGREVGGTSAGSTDGTAEGPSSGAVGPWFPGPGGADGSDETDSVAAAMGTPADGTAAATTAIATSHRATVPRTGRDPRRSRRPGPLRIGDRRITSTP